MLNKKKIEPSNITFTPKALKQLLLIINNDFTLCGKFFRILVSGKGCDGFSYSTGFSDIQEDDFLIPIKAGKGNIEVIVDPFTAFYLRKAEVDYIYDPKTDSEGFVVSNSDQEKYSGKFWMQNKQKIPPLTTTSS